MGDSINAAPKASAPVARSDSLRLPANVFAMICPNAMRIMLMLRHDKRDRGSAVPLQLGKRPIPSIRPSLTFPRWNFWQTARVIAVRTRFAATSRLASHIHRRAGESQLRVLPNERALPRESDGAPLPDSTSELPPIIRRAEVVAFALVALLLITVVAVLYAAKAFFLPVVTAFVVGTMLSPAAGLLERHRIPRAVSAVLIVGRGWRRRRLHRRPDLFPPDGMEHAPAGAGIAAPG